MAEINNVINVQLLPEGQLAGYDNINVVSILTSERGNVLNSHNRYQVYKNASAVANDFGANSKTADFANAFLGTTPNPISAGGALVIGYWRAANETVSAKCAQLVGAELSEASVIAALQLMNNAGFDITVNGTVQTVTGLDFSNVISLQQVAQLLSAAINGVKVSLTAKNQLILSTETHGKAAAITTLRANETSDFVGAILGLADNGGAVITAGADEARLVPETKLAAISQLQAQVNIKGACFIDRPDSTEALELAAWSKANSVILYDVFSDNSNLELNAGNVVWKIKLSGYDTYRCLFSKAGNRKLAASYMARNHVVNFAAENTALTMHLKTLNVAAEEYSEDEITKAKNVGLDLYTVIKNTPVVLTSGANNYVDNVYNLMAYIDAVQTDVFNLLKATATKIPQTTRGVNQLIDTCEKTSRRYVRAGVIGAGSWSSPDFFGNLDVFKRAIEREGFYWLAGSLAEQSQADRQARKSPVLQNAIKNAGAVHSADIIINFNY